MKRYTFSTDHQLQTGTGERERGREKERESKKERERDVVVSLLDISNTPTRESDKVSPICSPEYINITIFWLNHSLLLTFYIFKAPRFFKPLKKECIFRAWTNNKLLAAFLKRAQRREQSGLKTCILTHLGRSGKGGGGLSVWKVKQQGVSDGAPPHNWKLYWADWKL